VALAHRAPSTRFIACAPALVFDDGDKALVNTRLTPSITKALVVRIAIHLTEQQEENH